MFRTGDINCWLPAVVLLLGLLLQLSFQAADNDCGDAVQKKCTGAFKGFCCSKKGKCGTTDEFCSKDNCDEYYSGDFSECELDYLCGSKWGGKKCAGLFKGSCCGKNGTCGRGRNDERCRSDNCDVAHGNRCGLDSECGPKKKMPAEGCTRDFEHWCCSKDGKCGISDEFCNPSKKCDKDVDMCTMDDKCGPMAGGKKCSGMFKDECCGKYGVCGRMGEGKKSKLCKKSKCLPDYGAPCNAE